MKHLAPDTRAPALIHINGLMLPPSVRAAAALQRRRVGDPAATISGQPAQLSVGGPQFAWLIRTRPATAAFAAARPDRVIDFLFWRVGWRWPSLFDLPHPQSRLQFTRLRNGFDKSVTGPAPAGRVFRARASVSLAMFIAWPEGISNQKNKSSTRHRHNCGHPRDDCDLVDSQV